MRLLSGSLALQALGGTPTDHRDSWYPLDTADSLRSWLTDQATRWEADDPCFAAHRAVGLAELNAGATYRSFVQSRYETAKGYQNAPGRSAVEDTTRMLIGGDKAVAGLRAFVEGRSDADDDVMRARRARAALKLKACGESEADRTEAVAVAEAACVEWQALQAAEARLEAARLAGVGREHPCQQRLMYCAWRNEEVPGWCPEHATEAAAREGIGTTASGSGV